jgi:hypothetical protein
MDGHGEGCAGRNASFHRPRQSSSMMMPATKYSGTRHTSTVDDLDIKAALFLIVLSVLLCLFLWLTNIAHLLIPPGT